MGPNECTKTLFCLLTLCKKHNQCSALCTKRDKDNNREDPSRPRPPPHIDKVNYHNMIFGGQVRHPATADFYFSCLLQLSPRIRWFTCSGASRASHTCLGAMRSLPPHKTWAQHCGCAKCAEGPLSIVSREGGTVTHLFWASFLRHPLYWKLDVGRVHETRYYRGLRIAASFDFSRRSRPLYLWFQRIFLNRLGRCYSKRSCYWNKTG